MQKTRLALLSLACLCHGWRVCAIQPHPEVPPLKALAALLRSRVALNFESLLQVIDPSVAMKSEKREKNSSVIAPANCSGLGKRTWKVLLERLGSISVAIPALVSTCAGLGGRIWKVLVETPGCFSVAIPVLVSFLVAVALRHVVFLKPDEQLLLETFFDKKTRDGPGIHWFVPIISKAKVRKAILLGELEYMTVTDTLSGVQRTEAGPNLFFVGAYEILGTKCRKHVLAKDEYIKVQDSRNGDVRVVQGPCEFVPTPTESTPDGKQNAISLDGETAVLVESKDTGQQRLVKDSGMFFPDPLDEILEIRKLIRVEPHEVAIVQSSSGDYIFHSGRLGGNGTVFFLPPHHELVTMRWGSAASPEEVADNKLASGRKTVNYKVPVTKIDTRAQYAFFEYNVRTADNVELILEGTIFWQVVDVPKMIETTGDPKGDVWYHARSCLIQAVSRVTLEKFMAEFNDIVSKAASADDHFYSDRGVRMHALEVTRYECADAQTSGVLQEIIQETTNRINRMQKQQSDNDVQREKISGEIEVEKQTAALVQARCSNERMQAINDGEADGLRLAKSASTFFSILNETLPENEARLQLFQFFKDQQEATKRTEHLASGKAHLFLAPEDVNLKVNM